MGWDCPGFGCKNQPQQCKNYLFGCKSTPFWVQKSMGSGAKTLVFRCNPHVSGAIFACFGCKKVAFWVQFGPGLGAIVYSYLIQKFRQYACNCSFHASRSNQSKIFAPKRVENCTQNTHSLHPKHAKIAPETWGLCTGKHFFSPKSCEMFTVLWWNVHNLWCKYHDFRCKKRPNKHGAGAKTVTPRRCKNSGKRANDWGLKR